MGQLTLTLSAHTIIGVDTNPFIYFFERHPQYFALAEELFRYLKQPAVMGISSIITLIETCVQPQRENRLDLVETYERALLNSQQVQMLVIDPMLARRAVRLRAQYGFRVPDALQVGAALERGATLFVTNDRDFQKMTELDVLILDDYV